MNSSWPAVSSSDIVSSPPGQPAIRRLPSFFSPFSFSKNESVRFGLWWPLTQRWIVPSVGKEMCSPMSDKLAMLFEDQMCGKAWEFTGQLDLWRRTCE